MNDIEDRLRDTYRAVAQAIRPETIRPAVLPAPPRQRSGRPATRLAPLAAAVAMTAVTAAAAVVPHLLADSPRPATMAGPGAQGATAEPRYFADANGQVVELRDAATGKVLNSWLPPANPWQAGPVAIDGGTKFLAGTMSDSPCGGGNPFEVYQLTPGEPSGPKLVATLPGFIEEFTASTDGSTLAYFTSHCQGGRPANSYVLGVIRNGVSREWTAPSSVNPGSLSLSADGSELGYVNFTQAGSRGSAWVLPTSSPSGSLPRWSRPVYVPARHGQQALSLMLNPGGQSAYLVTAPANQSAAMTETLAEYDTATGARLRTLHTWNLDGLPSMVADGNHALIWHLHLSSVDEVNLTTGTATTFRQLPDAGDNILSIAW
jgi:hypothetical protein